MNHSGNTKALTVRLPSDLYRSSVEIARRRRVSLNSLVHESLKQQIATEEEAQWREWFDKLGEDSEEASVEYAFAAQAEVIMGDEY